MSRTVGKTGAGALIALALAGPASADREPAVHALTGARIVVAPGQVIESGTLVIRNGLIEAVGADVAAPDDARVWELPDATLYPGLIESYRTLDWPSVPDEPRSQTGHDNALVVPERSMAQHLHEEDTWTKLRAAGFTTAVLVPENGLFRGWSVLTHLGEGDPRNGILRPTVAQNAALVTSSDGGYPNSRMGSVALFRQTLLDARHHAAAQKAYASNPRQMRPRFHAAFEALAPVAAGEAPLVLESRDPQDAFRLLRLAEEFDLDAVLVGNGREYQWLDAVLAEDVPLILPVNFPKAPKVDEDKPQAADLAALRHWDRAPDNPRLLIDGGADVALTTHGLSDPAKLHEHLATALERGLSAEKALAALTTVPARRLGIEDRAGTLEAGKTANVIVADGELFTDGVKLRALWIDGVYTELKKLDPPTVDPIGTWEIIIDAGPGGQLPVTAVFTGSVEDLDGSLKTAGGALPLADAFVSGETVEFSLDSTPLGMPGMVTLLMTIDGDSCSGTGTSPQGPFTFTGERTDRPTPEVIR